MAVCMFSNIYFHTIDSVTTSELNGLYSVKSVLSLELSRQELGASIECRVETPALENVVSNHINIDLQGNVCCNQSCNRKPNSINFFSPSNKGRFEWCQRSHCSRQQYPSTMFGK